MADREPGSRSELAKDLAFFATVGSQVLGLVGAGLAVGYLGWKRWGLPPWVIAVTSLVGLAMATRQIVRLGQLRGEGRD